MDKVTKAIREKAIGQMRPVEMKLEEAIKLFKRNYRKIIKLRVAIISDFFY